MGWRGPITNRQYLAWQHWLKLQWNKPDKRDWYFVRLYDVIRQSVSSKEITPSKPLKFDFKAEEKKKKPTAQEISEWGLARWRAMTGMIPGVKAYRGKSLK